MVAGLSAHRGIVTLASAVGAAGLLWSSRSALHGPAACGAEAGFAALLCGFVVLRQRHLVTHDPSAMHFHALHCRRVLRELYVFSYVLALTALLLKLALPGPGQVAALEQFGRAYFLALLTAMVFPHVRARSGVLRAA